MTDTDLPVLDREVAEILNRRPAVGLAVGVVRDGTLQAFAAHGLADIATRTPIGEDTGFRVASITKTFTAIAVMQLWEQGMVDLDAPAGEYLRAYRLLPRHPGWRPVTLRHLLTHTAGIGEEAPRSRMFRRDFGESVAPGRPLPALVDFYGGSLRIDAEPGTRFRYSDHGPATLGQIVQDVTRTPFDRYLREQVFLPLGMDDTDVVLTDRVRSRLATGYQLRTGGPRPVAAREWVTTGASSACSTPRDMARYLAALAGGGANDHGSVLKPATVATMFEAHYRNDPRLPGMGLGFFRVDAGDHTVVEHQGILPGFDSQIFVAPDDGTAVLAFTNGTRRGMTWLPVETGRLLDRLIGIPGETVRTDVPHHPEFWSELCGWYELQGPISDVRLRATMGAGAEVFVRGGKLRLRFLTPVPVANRALPLLPDDPEDPYVFRLDLSGVGFDVAPRVVFGRDATGRTTALHLALMPVSLVKRPAATNPRRWTTGVLAAAGTAVAVRRLLSSAS